MYAHRVTQRLDGLTVKLELPPEFAGCDEAEIIILPVVTKPVVASDWPARVQELAGRLGADFPDDIDREGLAEDLPRRLEAFE